MLSGAAAPVHLRQNTAAIDLHLDDGELTALGELAEPAAQYWATRSDLAWS